MSHFSTIKTQIKKIEPLILALNHLGYSPNLEKKIIKGYRGKNTDVDVSINLPSNTNVGFKWDKNSHSYELVTDLDLWKYELPVERFLSKVNQMYAYHTIIKIIIPFIKIWKMSSSERYIVSTTFTIHQKFL